MYRPPGHPGVVLWQPTVVLVLRVKFMNVEIEKNCLDFNEQPACDEFLKVVGAIVIIGLWFVDTFLT